MLWHRSRSLEDRPFVDLSNRRVFLGRQPILDRDRRTFGYELLYRSGPDGQLDFDDPDDATQAVIQRSLLDWGLEKIIGDRFGFINASPQLVVKGNHRALPPEGIIFELRVDDDYDGPTMDALARARRDGYHFALDNVNDFDALERSALLAHVSIVKVEVSRSAGELTEIVELVREMRPGVLIVAEKVETDDDFRSSMEAGFDLFEGYFFARPEVLSKEARPASVGSSMALLAEMQRADIDIDRIERIVGGDPSLAFRLLAVVNSSAFGLDRRVESLRHAIVLLGISQVRHLATLLALSAAKGSSEELIALGATRARLASNLAPTPELRGGASTVGLLSVTDALYHAPMNELLEELPVTQPIRDALLNGDGEYGRILEMVLLCESADLDRLEELAPGRLEEIQEAYGEAVQWADTLRAQITSGRSKTRLPSRPAASMATA